MKHMIPPVNARPMGSFASAAIYLRSIGTDIAHKLVLRRRRTDARVTAEYDGGTWSRDLRERQWERASSLADYLDFRASRVSLRATIDSRLWSVPAGDYYAFRREKLARLLAHYAPGANTLTEIGCGTGHILLGLSLARRWPTLTGLDLSETGVEVARKIARHFAIENVEFGQIDLRDPASPGFAGLAGQTVFSHYCLEQLPNATEQVFRNLIAARIERAILIEPSFELLSWTSLRQIASKTYVLRQDYQRSIVRTARKLEREGAIRIIDARPLDFVSGVRNTPTLLVWEPL